MKTKICPKCGIRKPMTEFSAKSKAKGTFSSACKPCHKAYWHDWYERNGEHHREKVSVSKAKRKLKTGQTIFDLKRDKPCVDCGVVYHPFLMDYDHLDGDEKTSSISLMIGNGVPLKEILEEIKKCELVCALCHRLRTLRRLQARGLYLYK